MCRKWYRVSRFQQRQTTKKRKYVCSHRRLTPRGRDRGCLFHRPRSSFLFVFFVALQRLPLRPSRSLVFSHPLGLLPLLSSPFLCCRPIHRPHPVTVDTPPPWWESRLRGSGGGGSRQGGGLRDRRPRDRRDRNRSKRGTASPDHDPMPVPALIAVGVRHSPSSLWVLVVRPGRVPSTLRRLLRPFSLGGRSVGRSRCKSRTRTYGW